MSKYKVQVGQQIIYYEVLGEGEPLVLIHGLSASSRWWMRNIGALSKRYRLYLVDLPGFGRMWHRLHSFHLDEVAVDLALWMDSLGLQQVYLMGHSMGGYLSLWLASHYPERFLSLVLVSPAGVPHIRSVSGYLLPLLVAILYLRPRFLPVLLADAFRAGPVMIIRAAQDLMTKDVREYLTSISLPTLLVWGENDTLVPPLFGEVLLEQLPNAQLLILKRAGHVSMFDQPALFNGAVLSFLSGQIVGNVRR